MIQVAKAPWYINYPYLQLAAAKICASDAKKWTQHL